MDTHARKQDMPPSGGFRPINYERVPAKSYLSASKLFFIFVATTGYSVFMYRINYKREQKKRIEMRSALHGILPLLLAERDRAFLKQLRKNREEERELMKDVKDWEVGTYYGEPIYKTTPDDTLFTPRLREWYIHNDYNDAKKRLDIRHWD